MPDSLPNYPSPIPAALRAVLARLARRRLSIRADAVRMCAHVQPPIRYTGLQNIPSAGPILLTVNHYHRPGFNTAWIALGISSMLPADTAWIMSNEWLFQGNPFAFVLRPLMRFVLRSFTLTYSFLPMPTMIAGYSTPQQRTSGVRQVIERLRAQPDLILGLTPEGMDSPDSGLGLPPSGAGRFILHIQQMGLCILPIAVEENDGCLCITIGESYTLQPPADLSSSDLDLWARGAVMQPIASLLHH